MKKLGFMCFFAILTTIFNIDSISAYTSDVRLVIDNQEVTGLPTPPIIRDDSVLVPARAVFERMGGIVGWHSGNRQVTVNHGSSVLVMTIDDTIAMLNGVPVRMATAPIILNDSTLIPIRFPAEVFGFEVDWNSDNRTAIVNSPNNGNGTVQEPSTTSPPTTNPPTTMPMPPTTAPPTTNAPTTTNPPPTTGYTLARNVSASPISALSHPVPATNLMDVLTPSDTGTGSYVVLASSPISNVTYFVLRDNRVVVVIHNAIAQVSGSLPVYNTLPITGARITQYTTNPMVSRIVFDAASAAEFSLSLSENRKELTIAFVSNNITSIMPVVGADSDTITIVGDFLPSARISTEGFPHFFTINIDNAQIPTKSTAINGGNFATHFVTGQRADGSAYIQVHVGSSWPSFSVVNGNNSIDIVLHAGINGVNYNSSWRELRISRATGFSMDINQVQHINEYFNLRYTIMLPNSAEMLGHGEISVMDGLVNTIRLERGIGGNARIVFDTNRVLNFTVLETPDYYIIRAQQPRDTGQFIVVIDPGHGGSNPGSAHNGIREPELTLTISNKVMQLLDNNPFITGYMTRRDNYTVYNHMRAEFANELSADLFVSIHANAAELSPGVINTTANGIETLYNVGYAEQNANNAFTSRQFAETVQRHMVARTGARDRELVYASRTIVLRYTEMPAVLVEVGFLTNPQEAARLATSQYQWLLAHAIYDAIVEMHNRFPAGR